MHLIAKDLQYFPKEKPEEQDNVAKGVQYRTAIVELKHQIILGTFWPLCKIGRAKAADPRPPLRRRKAASSKGIPQGQRPSKRVA